MDQESGTQVRGSIPQLSRFSRLPTTRTSFDNLKITKINPSKESRVESASKIPGLSKPSGNIQSQLATTPAPLSESTNQSIGSKNSWTGKGARTPLHRSPIR